MPEKQKAKKREVRITIVSTSHVAQESLERISRVMEKTRPDCVAVELDAARLAAMRQGGGSNIEALKRLGFSTFLLFFIMKAIQDWLGKKTGIFPGREMLFAVEAALKNNVKPFLIDQRIDITFQRIKEIGTREKLRLVWFVVKGLFQGIFRRGDAIDLNRVPEDRIIGEAMKVFQKEFPLIYKAFVTDRDRVMAANIRGLANQYQNIMVVVGAGHEKGLKEQLSV